MNQPDFHIEGKAPIKISESQDSRRSGSTHISRKTSWGTPIPPPSRTSMYKLQDDDFDDIEFQADSDISTSDFGARWNTLDNIAALGLSFNTDYCEGDDQPQRQRFSLEDDLGPSGNKSLSLDPERPFNKWMKSFQRKAVGTQRRKTVSGDLDGSGLERELFGCPTSQSAFHHKKSSSGSSFGFVTAVKSASISLASFSVAPRSKKTGISSRHHKTDRSSKASNAGRLSEDSSYIARGIVIDQAVTNRLLQRRRVLEELITTEESYVADLKFLMNVHVTLMSSIPTLSMNLRASINRNLNQIVELHEELLGDLHRVVPNSEYTQLEVDATAAPPLKGHSRWRSLDAVPEHAGGPSWLQKIPGMTTEPKVAAEVAKVFGKKVDLISSTNAVPSLIGMEQMNRFFVYEEYGAKYELMIKDVASAYRTVPQWEAYQKGIEALASSLSSINSQHKNSKKALTIGDLLVKPIQRVCKYPLLFAELLKQTPVCDCPSSHMEIEDVLVKLREATTEINRAIDDPRMKATMERSWLLQDRLVFPNKSDSRSKDFVRGLGHVHLCGVLHVSWQTKDGVDGQYLISALYRDFLLLASASKVDQIYTVQACIGLNEIKVEEVDNGRGLQCHTAPFSWKLVFEYDHQLLELTMTACSPKEELEWRSRLADGPYRNRLNLGEQAVSATFLIDVKPLGTVFGKPGTVARRISIHRATTVGPKTGLCQVIIKNTNASRDVPHSASSASINRSQSLFTSNRIPVLAPSRAERVRLENLLSDVWTRDIIPFPGMAGRARSEHLVRASASSMMRKLSVASIASNFTKRSGSIASLHRTAEDDSPVENDKNVINRDESTSITAATVAEAGDMTKPRLSIIQDEKENFQHESIKSLPSSLYGSKSGQYGTMRNSAPLRLKNSWAPDGQLMITPPLRTSSANSTTRGKIGTLMTVSDITAEDKENEQVRQPPQGQAREKEQKSGIWAKGVGKNRIMGESIRSIFR